MGWDREELFQERAVSMVLAALYWMKKIEHFGSPEKYDFDLECKCQKVVLFLSTDVVLFCVFSTPPKARLGVSMFQKLRQRRLLHRFE